MSRTPPSNSRQQADDVDRLFRARDAEPGTSIAYRTDSAETLPVRGDEEAPHLKTPPFATDPQLWVRDMALPLADAADYAVTPGDGLDCLQQRLLQIYFELTIAEGGDEIAQLSFIPEGSAAGQWYVVGVVDLTVTAFTPVSARFPYGNLMSRTFAPSELRSTQFAGPGVVRFILAYDVSPFEAFRMNVRDLVGSGGNTLTMRTAFSQ
jgi:hypothetical protein